jgi:hypothetical protein
MSLEKVRSADGTSIEGHDHNVTPETLVPRSGTG